MLKAHLAHCIENAIISGDKDEQRHKVSELIELLERTRRSARRRSSARPPCLGARTALESLFPLGPQRLAWRDSRRVFGRRHRAHDRPMRQ
jgi:hypothetical protein